jgi:hypothetical protein
VSPQRLKRPFCNKFIKDLKQQNFGKETIASKNKQKAQMTKTTIMSDSKKQANRGRIMNNTQSLNNLHQFQERRFSNFNASNNKLIMVKHSNDFNDDARESLGRTEDMKEDHYGKNQILKNSAKPSLIHGMQHQMSANVHRKQAKPSSYSFVNSQSDKLNHRRNQYKEKKLSMTQHVKITILPSEEDNQIVDFRENKSKSNAKSQEPDRQQKSTAK